MKLLLLLFLFMMCFLWLIDNRNNNRIYFCILFIQFNWCFLLFTQTFLFFKRYLQSYFTIIFCFFLFESLVWLKDLLLRNDSFQSFLRLSLKVNRVRKIKLLFWRFRLAFFIFSIIRLYFLFVFFIEQNLVRNSSFVHFHFFSCKGRV